MANKFAIMGSGCIGCAVGISLALCKYDVSFIGRKSERFDKIETRKSLSLIFPDSGSEPHVIQTENITSDEQKGLMGRNVILIATKRTANKNIATIIARYAIDGALVIMLQNGLNASKELLDVFKQENREDLIVLDS